MNIAQQVSWMSSDLKNALMEIDFSMLDYPEDAYRFCVGHPTDTSDETDLTELGRQCRDYLIVTAKIVSATDQAYEDEVAGW